MKLWYIANARIPTEKAHGLQIVKMCEAFARQDVDVELIIPFRQQSEQMRQVESLWDYYDVATRFVIKRLSSPDFIKYHRFFSARLITLLYMLQSLLFAIMAAVVTRKVRGIYYTRDWYVLFVLALMKSWHSKPIFFEAHEMHGASHSKLFAWLLRRIDGLIVITQALQTYYKKFGVTVERIIVAADGIDHRRLARQISKDAVRTELDLPLTSKIICYTGHLFRWKGVYTLTEAMRYLPEDYRLYIIGGMVEDRQALQQFIAEQQLPRITLVKHVPYHAVPAYLAAADVLALPNSAAQSISRDCTSPLKLFEYMAAQRPIVASDLPSLREVLRHKQNAYLVTPDQPQAFANGIQQLMNDPDLRTQIVKTAYTDVQAFTWDNRAKQILAFLRTAIHVI